MKPPRDLHRPNLSNTSNPSHEKANLGNPSVNMDGVCCIRCVVMID